MKTLRAFAQLYLIGWLIRLTPSSDFESLTLLGALNETVARDVNPRDAAHAK